MFVDVVDVVVDRDDHQRAVLRVRVSVHSDRDEVIEVDVMTTHLRYCCDSCVYISSYRCICRYTD